MYLVAGMRLNLVAHEKKEMHLFTASTRRKLLFLEENLNSVYLL